jgi:hypothetical protein
MRRATTRLASSLEMRCSTAWRSRAIRRSLGVIFLLALSSGSAPCAPQDEKSSDAPPARFAKVRGWEGKVHIVYDHKDRDGKYVLHGVSDWTVTLSPIDPHHNPYDFTGPMSGTASGTYYFDGLSASGQAKLKEDGFPLSLDKDGYEFSGLGFMEIPASSSDVGVIISGADSWDIRRPFPAQGMVLSGTAEVTRSSTTDYFDENSRYVVTWEFWPAGTRPRFEITKLEQSGGPRTSDPKQMVFQRGRLTLLTEAIVRPESDAKIVQWEAPAIGTAKPVITTAVRPGGVSAATIVYQGLPEQNSSFGDKQLKATIQDRTAEKPFQVFFERDGTDSPQNQGKSKLEPNWYVYWKQGPVPELDRFVFSHDPTMAAGYSVNDSKLYITQEGPGVIPAIDTRLTTSREAHSYHLKREKCEGIRAVAAIVRHELKHKELHETKGDDYDADRVPDSVETSSPSPYLDPFQPNTYTNFNINCFYPDLNLSAKGCESLQAGSQEEKDHCAQLLARCEFAQAASQQVMDHCGQLRVKGDNELLAIIAEAKKLAHESQDWAFPGTRAKKP